MGIKGLNYWIGRCCMRATKVMREKKFNNLFIDANCILYHAVSSVREKENKLTEPLLAEILRCLDLIVKLSNPSDLIFIAFDGPMPLAKQRSQRQSRFKDVVNKNGFDTIIFTAGTEFMYILNQEIKNFIKKQSENDEVWKKAKVILSGPNVQGEGEHKIADYIRELKRNNEWNSKHTNCIFGNDTDNIILSLNLHEPNIWIMKEKGFFKTDLMPFVPRESSIVWKYNDFRLVSIDTLREILIYKFKLNGIDFNSENIENIISDFSILSSFYKVKRTKHS